MVSTLLLYYSMSASTGTDNDRRLQLDRYILWHGQLLGLGSELPQVGRGPRLLIWHRGALDDACVTTYCINYSVDILPGPFKRVLKLFVNEYVISLKGIRIVLGII